MTYLMVEDNDDHAVLLERSLKLESPQNQIHRVHNGVEALTYLRQSHSTSHPSRPDVVLLDLKLPKMDGLEVLEQLKSDSQLRMIPVIILTTSDSSSDREQAYARNVNSYLVKPMEYSAFCEMAREICHYWRDVNRGVDH